jgi:hypothetical protein
MRGADDDLRLSKRAGREMRQGERAQQGMRGQREGDREQQERL